MSYSNEPAAAAEGYEYIIICIYILKNKNKNSQLEGNAVTRIICRFPRYFPFEKHNTYYTCIYYIYVMCIYIYIVRDSITMLIIIIKYLTHIHE